MTQRADRAAPVIIEAAVNGQTQKRTNPNVPRSSEEIAEDALRCLDAGAAIVHTHIDDILVPGDEAAARYLEHFVPILEHRPDALLYPTLGFGETIQEKLEHVERIAKACRLRLGFVDPGSVNLGGAGPDGLPLPMDYTYRNTPAEIRAAFDLCERLALGPSIAIFEPGFLRHALAYWRAGRLPAGAMLKLYLGGEYGYLGAGHPGLGFGLPGESWALDVYLRLLGDCPVPWSVAVIGGDVFEGDLVAHALDCGGHLHVGLEDYAGDAAPTNVELVERAVAACRAAGREVASPEDASRLLELPG